MTKVRILVADDHEMVRRGLRSVIESQEGWEVSGEATDGREAVQKVKQFKPDVVILDISMPGLNGLEATRQIMKVHPSAKVLILTVHESDQLAREVLDAGARGYLLKSDAGQDLVTAIEALRRNKTFFTANVAQMILDGYLAVGSDSSGEIRPTRDRLTPRQKEIVQLLAEGKSSKEVAVALSMSVKTAETHRANIMRRLDIHCLSDLVRYAIRNNIVQP